MAAAREAGQPPRLLLVYGGVEAALGVWALAFPALFAAARTLPFERAALEATWRRCRGPDCWTARRDAGALLGEAPDDVARS